MSSLFQFLSLFTLSLLLPLSLSQSDTCDPSRLSAYTRRRFSPQQVQRFCHRRKVWTQEAVVSKGRASADVVLTPRQMDYFKSVERCDLICLCRSIPLCADFLGKIEGVLGNGTLAQITDFLNSGKARTNGFGRTGRGGRAGKARRPVLTEQQQARLGNFLSEMGSVLQGVGKAGGGGPAGGASGPRFRGKRQNGIDFRGKLPPVVRKEIRAMTDDERNRYFAALNGLKNSVIDGMSKFDILVVYHTPSNAPGAHFGPAFLPFHRELLKYFEVALRLEDPSVAIPYWDSTLDEPLPDAADSILWSDDFYGTSRGSVTSGHLRDWKVRDTRRARQISPSLQLVRNVGASRFGSLYRPADIAQISRNVQTFKDLTFCIDPFFEMVHGAVHLYVGGHMDPLDTSPNDPLFFSLHAFVDRLWEDFRERKQRLPNVRQRDYPSDAEACNSFHFGTAEMKPFSLRNVDGLSDSYTREFYTYDPSPACGNNCGNSRYLYCDRQKRRCVSKVKMGGNCAGLDADHACARGRCVRGECVMGSPPVTAHPMPVPVTLPPRPRTTTPRERRTRPTEAPFTPRPFNESETVWFPVTLQRYQDRLVKAVPNAQLRATVLQTGQVYLGEIASNRQYPYFVGAAYVQIPNPALQKRSVMVKLDAMAPSGRACDSFCYDPGVGYNKCEIQMQVSNNPKRSVEVAYTPYKEQAPYLSWNGPERQPDKYYFLCEAGSGSGPNPGTGELTKVGVLGFRNISEPDTGSTTTETEYTGGRPGGNSGGSYKANECINYHRCCGLWQSVGECQRNSKYMHFTCPMACGKCTDNVFRNVRCIDKFIECSSWASKGECDTGQNPVWMEENCAKSCGTCGRSRDELKPMCGSPAEPGCDNFHSGCDKWARRNECQRNKWWMGENCPVACKLCTPTYKG